MSSHDVKGPLLGPKMTRQRVLPIVGFALGAVFGITAALSGMAFRAVDEDPLIDFEFQILGINTTRQDNKTLDVYVRWRYRPGSDHCPFSPTDNTCIQYQKDMHSMILNLTTQGTPELPLGAEWELVTLAICTQIWGGWKSLISAVSTAVHVNGDGRSAEERAR